MTELHNETLSPSPLPKEANGILAEKEGNTPHYAHSDRRLPCPCSYIGSSTITWVEVLFKDKSETIEILSQFAKDTELLGKPEVYIMLMYMCNVSWFLQKEVVVGDQLTCNNIRGAIVHPESFKPESVFVFQTLELLHVKRNFCIGTSDTSDNERTHACWHVLTQAYAHTHTHSCTPIHAYIYTYAYFKTELKDRWALIMTRII